MQPQKFLNEGIDLGAFLTGSIASLSIRRLSDKRPDAIVFTAADNSRLVVQSYVQDVVDIESDLEIGILTFSKNVEKLKDEEVLNLPPILNAPREIKKIITYENDTCFEVGFQLYTENFLPLIVLSGFVGRLAVFGCGRGSLDCVPEFGAEHYELIPWL
ncbi:hypothetical protein [Parasphingorhabdus sp.]|uniref:hypothetical protein n=1 Tax=Parasphingorhabdus sp. TaxID=2709688 RepID=UPI003BAEA41E